jgi:hypothetical protein
MPNVTIYYNAYKDRTDTSDITYFHSDVRAALNYQKKVTFNIISMYFEFMC